MRRVVLSLLLLLFAVHALVPALTTYVCSGMSGRHFLQPCCPAEAAQDHAVSSLPTLGSGRCCDPRDPVVIDARQPSADELQHALRAPLAVAAVLFSPVVSPLPSPVLLLGRARGSPLWRAAGPAPSQRQVLRI